MVKFFSAQISFFLSLYKMFFCLKFSIHLNSFLGARTHDTDLNFGLKLAEDITSPNFQISEKHITLDTLVRGVGGGLAPPVRALKM